VLFKSIANDVNGHFRDAGFNGLSDYAAESTSIQRFLLEFVDNRCVEGDKFTNTYSVQFALSKAGNGVVPELTKRLESGNQCVRRTVSLALSQMKLDQNASEILQKYWQAHPEDDVHDDGL